MTIEEIFCELQNKYGEDFVWNMLSISDKFFVEELKREIGQEHFLYHENVQAVAKCDANDDVLFVIRNDEKNDIYYIFHLTYSQETMPGFPKYEKFVGLKEIKTYLENQIVT